MTNMVFWSGRRATRDEAEYLIREHGQKAYATVRAWAGRARNRNDDQVARYWAQVGQSIRRKTHLQAKG